MNASRPGITTDSLRKRRKTASDRFAALTASGLAASTLFSAHAALAQTTRTWGGTSATAGGNWSDPANWGTSGVPVSGDLVVMGLPGAGGTRTTNNDINGLTVGGITFNAAGYTLAGNSLNIGGTVVNNASGTGANLFSLTSVLQQNTEYQVNGTYRTEVSGDITGNFGITKTGTGNMRLTTVAKTYTGDTVINAGTLELLNLQDILPFGVGKGNVFIAAGATLLNNNANVDINGLSGAGAITRSGSNTRSFTFGNNNAGGVYTGTIVNVGGSSSVNKVGTGTQTLGGSVTTLNFSIQNGAVTVTAGNTLGQGTLTLGTATTSGRLTNGNAAAGGSITDAQTTLTLATGSADTLDFGVGTGGAVFSFTGFGTGTGALSILNWAGSTTGGGLDQLLFSSAGAGVPVPSSQFLFVNPNGLSGTFAATQLASGELVPVVPAATPEPSSWAALGLGALGLGGLIARRRSLA